MLQNCNTWEIAKVFFDEPSTEHNLKEICKKTGLSHTSVKGHLKKLEREEIIQVKRERKGERVFPKYMAKDSEEFKFKKRLDLINRLKSSGLLDFIVSEFQPNCVILFGSGIYGEDIEDSDVDLFVQASGKELDLSNFENKLNRSIEIHTKSDFEDYPKELKNNIINGIILYGFLKVFE
ncbi:MAG: winged helix-turn-helix transcriptional regulator [Candidatus Aenigmatarchaeota archaeon]